MKQLLLLLTILFLSTYIKAQTPTKCVEVESFFVDACGSPEQDNEMIRFIIGPSDLNVSSFTVTWYSNTWLGICQNATSALKTAAFNRTILGCGYLKEPVGGILPAGKEILLITSTAVDTLANSFANLNDTLIVIYQCPGATSGHFRNYNSTPLVRYAILNFSGIGGCSDTGTYDPNQLINSLGGYGGGSAIENGATVNFAWNGTPTYVNNGCNAPFIPLSANIINNDTTLCKGQTINLAATLNGTNRISWISSATGTFNRTDSTSVVFTPSTSAIYPIEFYALGYLTCDTASDTVTINAYIDNTRAPNDTAHCLIDTIPLNASGATSYNWTASSGYISCTNCSNPRVASNTSTAYYLSMTYGASCIKLDTVLVSILAQDSISMAQSDTSICIGNTINLFATSNNGYNWTGGTGSFSCTTCANPTMTITGSSTIVVTSSGVCKSADSIRVTSVAYDAFTLSNDTTICTGQTAIIGSIPFIPIYWSNSLSIPMGCTICSSTSISPTDTVKVFAISSGYCPVYDTVNVFVEQYPTINASPDSTICNGSSISLNVSGASSYTWSSNLGTTSLSCTSCTSPTVTPTGNTIYYVQSTGRCIDRDTVNINIINYPTLTHNSDTSICFGDTISLFVSGASGYIWNSPSGTSSLSCTTCSNPIATPTSNITYTVSNTGQCINTDTINVTIITPSGITVSNDTTICLGEAVRLFVSGGVSYNWNSATGSSSLSCTSCSNPLVNTLVSNTYYVNVSGTTCSLNDTINITVNPNTKINAGNDTSICNTQGVQLNASGASSYVWSSNRTPLTLSCTSCSNPIATPTLNTLYYVTSTQRCIIPDTVSIVVLPSNKISLGIDQTICDGQEATINATNGSYYNWSTLPATTFTCPNCNTYTNNYTSNTTYIVSDTSDCIFADTINIVVNANPIVLASNDTTIDIGATINISASGANTYQWIPSTYLDNNTSSSPQTTPTQNITYIVMGTDTNGCIAYDTITVKLNASKCKMAIPSGFSPNGDGLNDKFRAITNCNVKEFKLEIYNRYGEIVFSTNSIEDSWDGSFKEREQGINTFIYYIEGRYEDNENINYTGTITLIK
ncbi:MAG: gliding motility-associated C-terminal domain-containing protein [Bacteroidota bacterium]